MLETKNTMMETIESLNDVIENINLNSLSNIGKTTNLKLYDIAFNYSNIEDFEDLFYNFCEINYDAFIEYLDELDLKMTHIGNTSSFYIESNRKDFYSCYYQSEYEEKSNEEKLQLILNNEANLYGLYCDEIIFKNGKVYSIDKDYMDDEDIKFYTRELLDTIEIIKNINKAYEFIDNFKNEQIELFREFLEFNK